MASRSLLPLVFSFGCVVTAQEPPALTPPPPEYKLIVTGSYAPVPLEDVNRNIDTIDVRNLRLLESSLAAFLKSGSSVDLRQRGPGDIQGDLSIRGGTFAQSLVLLNGLRLNDTQSSHHNLDLPIPLEAITEVQVMRGSGSTQYGSDAVTGVVNILARPAEPEARLRGALGNFGTNQESASLAIALPHFSQQLVAARDFSTGFIPDRDYRNLGLASISHAQTALGNTDVLLSLSDRPFGAGQFYGAFNSWERTKGWFASARQELGPDTSVDFAYRRHTDLFVLYRDRPEAFTNRHAVESIEGAIRRKNDTGAGRLFYGGEVYADSIDSNNLGRHSRIREAAYAAWEGQWRKRFTYSAGLRNEIYGSFNNVLSPSFAAGLWLSPAWKIRAAISRSFRLPTYTDLYYHDPASAGSPNLRPESAWSYEAGVDWRPHSRVRLEATVFERLDRNLIDYVRYSPTDIYRATNFQSLDFTGVEASLHVRTPGGGDGTLEYTALHGNQSLIAGAISKYVFNYPVHSAVAGWTGPLGSQLVARTRIGALQRFSSNSYAIWDASVARSRGRLRPFLQLSNIASAVYQEIPGVALPKRTILAGLELRLHGAQ